MAATRPGDIPRDRIAQAINTLPTQVAGSRAGSDSGGEESAGGAASSTLVRAGDAENSGSGEQSGSGNSEAGRGADGSSGGDFGVKLLHAAALLTIVCVGLYLIHDFVGPVFLALTLVLTVRPIHRLLLRHRVPRWLSGTLTVSIIVVVLLAVVGLTAWSLAGLPRTLMSYEDKFTKLFQDTMTWLESLGLSTDQLSQRLADVLNMDTIISLLSQASGALMSVGSLMFVLALAIFFITIDTLSVPARARIVRDHDPDLYRALASFEGRVRQYWLVATLFGLLVSTLNYFVMMWLGIPLALAWALWTFVTNYIPNIGFILGVIPPALMGLVDSGPATALWILVIFTFLNVTIQGVLQPKIVGDAVGLSTTVTFLSLLFWAVVLGPLGTILAVPLTLFIKAIFVDSSSRSRWVEAFLVPESNAETRADRGVYDLDEPVREIYRDFTSRDSEVRTKMRDLRKISRRRKKGIRG
ncbi:AI-2E family transporter [Actinotignum sp. GS-2025g]|uniref:AI-2E family transporter n=1 Tax=unclassified Actinotignum TaxID=2632702 RepID=UPI002A82CE0C|nr:AI-2E family transporter [Actinotignum sp. SLA_B059]MDY5127090.1 AI-2E family transporter [Actinotignum sp. SLA_B059]